MKRITAVVLSVVVFLMAFPLFSFAVTSQKYSSLPEPVPDDRNKFLVVSNGSKNIIVWISTPLFGLNGESSGVEMYVDITSDGYVLHTVAPSIGFSYEVQKFDALTGEFIWSGWHSVSASSNDDAYTIPSLSGYKYYVSYGLATKKLASVTGYELLPITWNGNGNAALTLIQSKIDTLNSKLDTLNSRINTLNGSVDNIESDVDSINSILSSLNAETLKIYDELVLVYNRLNTTNTRLQSIITLDQQIYDLLSDEIPEIEDKLDTANTYLLGIATTDIQILSKLSTAVTVAEQIRGRLDTIQGAILNIESDLHDILEILSESQEEYSSQDTSEIDEYASREEELMSDRSEEIGSALDSADSVLDSSGVSLINNLMTSIIFDQPEISGLIIFSLAIGLVVLILGRKVG